MIFPSLPDATQTPERHAPRISAVVRFCSLLILSFLPRKGWIGSGFGLTTIYFLPLQYQWPGRVNFSKSTSSVARVPENFQVQGAPSQSFSRLLILINQTRKHSYIAPLSKEVTKIKLLHMCVKKGPGTKHQSSANISSSSTWPSTSSSASVPLSATPLGSSTGGKGSLTQWVHCDYIVVF